MKHPTHNQAPHFKLSRVGRKWGQTIAVKDLDLVICPGESIAVLGPSGGGKSTFLKMLSGRTQPTSGELFINSREVRDLSPKELRTHRRQCAAVEQGANVFPFLSVHRNVLLGQLPHWSGWKTLLSAIWPIERQKVEKLLAQMDLEDRMWEPAGLLSGGQQQRIAIARALLGQPSVLLADEPTSALDPALAKRMTSLIFAHQQHPSKILIWCTHQFELVREHVDRVLGINHGRLVFDLPPNQLQMSQLTEIYKENKNELRIPASK